MPFYNGADWVEVTLMLIPGNPGGVYIQKDLNWVRLEERTEKFRGVMINLAPVRASGQPYWVDCPFDKG